MKESIYGWNFCSQLFDGLNILSVVDNELYDEDKIRNVYRTQDHRSISQRLSTWSGTASCEKIPNIQLGARRPSTGGKSLITCVISVTYSMKFPLNREGNMHSDKKRSFTNVEQMERLTI